MARGVRRDAEKAAGYILGVLQYAVDRHVNAMVVPGREVDGREHAFGKMGCQILSIAQQLLNSEAPAFGLHKRISVDLSDLADVAVTGAGDFTIAAQRATTLSESSDKKRAETGIAMGVGLNSFSEIDSEYGDCSPDQEVLPRLESPTGSPVDHPRESVVGQTVLSSGEESLDYRVGHRA